ncbi:hypothetical protein GDO78_018839 [Eleutherodactylus coqui]|uniref:Uncharacterized protein n=1 Tax=Eleutherodactylus coqui TaxID=57060 RepID=A0A8J6EPB4_ELECQ|nr:hypothetical protein GDO78_018839 [Eleutherodactylus coqui]
MGLLKDQVMQCKGLCRVFFHSHEKKLWGWWGQAELSHPAHEPLATPLICMDTRRLHNLLPFHWTAGNNMDNKFTSCDLE